MNKRENPLSRFIISVGSLLLLILTPYVIQAEEEIKPTGTFSNMFYDKNTGDVSGYEVVIKKSDSGYSGTYRFAEGEPTQSVSIKPVIDGEMVSFTFEFPFKGIYGDPYKGQFIGFFSEKGVSGTMTDNESRTVHQVKLFRLHKNGILPDSVK